MGSAAAIKYQLISRHYSCRNRLFLWSSSRRQFHPLVDDILRNSVVDYGARGFWISSITSTWIFMIILKRVFGLAYSFFGEPNVTHFKIRHSTDTQPLKVKWRLTIRDDSSGVGATHHKGPLLWIKVTAGLAESNGSHCWINGYHNLRCVCAVNLNQTRVVTEYVRT